MAWFKVGISPSSVSAAQWASDKPVTAGDVKQFELTNNPTYSFVAPNVLKEEQVKPDVSVLKQAVNGVDYEVRYTSPSKMEIKFVTGGYKVKVNY